MRQYNVRKSRDAVKATLLRDPKVADIDVLAIQASWRKLFMATTHHPAKDALHLCYPPDESDVRPARVCFFVNKRLDHHKWYFHAYSRDTCSLTLEVQPEGQATTQMTIQNVSNPIKGTEDRKSVLPGISRLLETASAAETATEQMVVGDFNLHHSMWGKSDVPHTDPESEELIDLMNSFNLMSRLALGTVTYEEGAARTTMDLC